MTSLPADLLPTLLTVLALLVAAPMCYCWGSHRATARLRPVLLRLHRQVYTDHLTGLPNRRAATDYLHYSDDEQWVARIDVRWLGTVNNTHGHTAGDQLLQAVADALSAAAEPDGQAARFSGDEFLVTVRDNDDPQQPDQLTEQIRAALARHSTAHPHAPAPQVCIGWAATRQVSRAKVLEAVGIAVAHAKAFAPTHGNGSTACSVRYRDEPAHAPQPRVPTQRRAVDRSTAGS